MRNPLAILATLSVLAAGCVGPAPLPDPASAPVALTQVSVAPGTYVGRRVQWGGSIERLENHAQETWLEIVERPLNDHGRPRDSDQSGGRFIAKVTGFLDPVIYTRGRDVTITGTVDGESSRKIGEFDYRYVTVNAASARLWTPRTYVPVRYYDPFWYDPWFPYWPRQHHHH